MFDRRPSTSVIWILACAAALAACASNGRTRGTPPGADAEPRPDVMQDGGGVVGADGAVPAIDGGGIVGIDGGGGVVVDGGDGPMSDGGSGMSFDAGVDAGFDAGSDAGPRPECTGDAECSGSRRCLAGICRDPCSFGFLCSGTASGSRCQGGLCVQCTSDSHCGGRQRCDTSRYICVDQPVAPPTTQFGMFYSTWHCPIANARPIHDISEVLAGRQNWGPYEAFHYWDEPAEGYYCLSQNDGLLRRHAEQLRDAGIDFIFIDATNHPWRHNADRTLQMILEPLDRLLAVWSTVPGAPKVVPWVPITTPVPAGDQFTIDIMLARLAAYPGMHFEYLGRPLILITENEQWPVNTARESELSARYTIRRMWGALADSGPRWSFMQRCERSPTDSRPCNQRVSMRDGRIEHIPVAVAYQQNFMNDTRTATPKHRGLTFRKQFQRVFDAPETPIVTITGWNEWIAQRQRCGQAWQAGTCPCDRFPDGCFLDKWDVEYNRDIEPGRNEMGDYYVRLMGACISLYRSGASCDAAHAANLCCRAYSP